MIGLPLHAQQDSSSTKWIRVYFNMPDGTIFDNSLVNAGADILQLLPGIGPAYAERIIAYRKERGSFHSIGELENIDGIGPDTRARLRPNVVTDK